MTDVGVGLFLRPVEPRDEAAVVDLLNGALGQGPTGMISSDFYRWKHWSSPFGPSPGLLAESDGKVVGVRLLMRWELRANRRTVRAVRAVDTATHPGFQGRGIFRTLTLELLRRLEDAGEVDLVFNTPNASSRPGYLKMGWTEVGSLPVRMCPVRTFRVLRGARGALGTTAEGAGGPASSSVRRSLPDPPFDTAAGWLRSASDEVSTLLDEAAAVHLLHTPLSIRYLAWRYAGAPGLDYRFVPLENGGQLIGFAIGRMRPRGPLSEFTVAEVVVRAGDVGAARRLLGRLRRSGADHVTLHATSGSEVARVVTRCGYLQVPRHGLGLVANPRTSLPVDPTSLGSWSLSLGDLEVF